MTNFLTQKLAGRNEVSMEQLGLLPVEAEQNLCLLSGFCDLYKQFQVSLDEGNIPGEAEAIVHNFWCYNSNKGIEREFCPRYKVVSKSLVAGVEEVLRNWHPDLKTQPDSPYVAKVDGLNIRPRRFRADGSTFVPKRVIAKVNPPQGKQHYRPFVQNGGLS